MSNIVALLAFYFAFFLPLLSLFRPLQAALLSPLVGGLFSLFAFTIYLQFALPLLPTFLAVVFSTHATLLPSHRLRQRVIRSLKQQWRLDERIVLLIGVLAFLTGSHRLPPPAHDAKFIWLLQAHWMTGKASTFRALVATETSSYAHADYPKLIQSSVAVIWKISGEPNYLVATTFILLATLSATSLAALYVLRGMRRRSISFIISVASLLFLASLTTGQGLASQGYVDVLLAGILLSIAIIGSTQQDCPAPASDYLVLALLTGFAVSLKQEGLFHVLLLALVFFVFGRRRFALLATLTAMPFWFIWASLRHAWGVPSTSDLSGWSNRTTEIARPSSEFWRVMFEIFGNLGREDFVGLMLLLVVLFGLSRLVTDREIQATLRPMLLLSVMVVGATYAGYGLGAARGLLPLWYSSSFSRIMATPAYYILGALVMVLRSQVEASEVTAEASSLARSSQR